MSDAIGLDFAIAHLYRIKELMGSREWTMHIRKYNPGGLTAHQTVPVTGLHAGIDWDAGKVLLTPGAPLTELKPEQVEAIMQSVRKGGSWHAFEREKGLRQRIKDLEAEVASLRHPR